MPKKFHRMETLPPGVKDLPYPQPWEFIYENFFKQSFNGFYVDIGAHDGITYSNTAYFDLNLGWNGICIEPLIKPYEKLINNRNAKTYNLAISEKEGYQKFYTIDGYSEMLSGLVNNYDSSHKKRIKKEIKKYGGSKTKSKMQTQRLDQILDKNQISNVDYLSIDTEGSELDILNSIDFEKVKFKIISLEDHHTDKVNKLLIGKNFKFVKKIASDLIYINNSSL